MQKKWWFTATLLALLCATGCSTTSPFGREKLAISAAPRYVGGRGYAMYPTTPNLVENVKTTMTEMGMQAIHPVPEPNGFVGLEATTPDKRSVRVTIQSTGVRSTVGIKVGWVGDEPLSRTFLDHLENLQGALPSSALPDLEAEKNPGIIGGRISRDAVPDAIMYRNLEPGFNPTISP